jgi:hypothetical protein
MRIANIVAGLAFCWASQSFGQAAPAPGQLDFLAGDWAISDASGSVVGRSHIVVQAPGVALYEERRVGEEMQPLWFQRVEHQQAWTQLFVGAAGMVREFPASSAPGAWPVVMGADVTLRDGTPVRFRLTMTRASDDDSRRVLEMSRDQGTSWSTVFDYRYRRTGAAGT